MLASAFLLLNEHGAARVLHALLGRVNVCLCVCVCVFVFGRLNQQTDERPSDLLSPASLLAAIVLCCCLVIVVQLALSEGESNACESRNQIEEGEFYLKLVELSKVELS